MLVCELLRMETVRKSSALALLVLSACGSTREPPRDSADDSSNDSCVAAAAPEDAAFLGVGFPGTTVDRERRTIGPGWVRVEFVERNRLYFVDEAGHRAWLWVSFPIADVAVGTRFWLAADGLKKTQGFTVNPIFRFSLRTEQGGPVLFAVHQGTREGDPELLGAPFSFETICSSVELGCVSELLAANIEAEQPVRLLPGARAYAWIQGNPYELVLHHAWDSTSIDIDSCRVNDVVRDVVLKLDAVASNWRELAADQPVEPEALPACRLGSREAPPFELKNELDWDRLGPSAEFPVSLVSSSHNSATFGSPEYGEYGTVALSGFSSESRAVLERVRWLSAHEYNIVLRDGQAGAVLAVAAAGTMEELQALLERPDILGLSVRAEHQCEWVPDGCDGGVATTPLYLSEFVYGNDSVQRVAPFRRAAVTGSAGSFDGWIGMEPRCHHPGWRTPARFLARE